ncbi:MAG: hypothetical protein ABSA93_37895 [Streptosporangiaceae bacterium]
MRRRRYPLLATAGLILFEMASTLWWGPALIGTRHWSVPDDLWTTLVAAQRLLHGDLAGLYTQPTELISLPGTAVILVPLAGLLELCGISLGSSWAVTAHPAAWLLAGPYEIAVAAVPLFAADYIAERRSVTPRRRLFLAMTEAVALWGVTVRWGHPEDAFAVGLFLYAFAAVYLAPPEGRHRALGRAAWLTGAAIAVQPLVLLGVPVLLAGTEWRRMPGFLARAALPPAVLLGVAAAANWGATFQAIAHQPNFPALNHPTLWTSIAPRMADGSVATGPARLIAIAAACGIGLYLRYRGNGPPDLLWWLAVALALRSVFEPVMAAYYLWPALAVALLAATVEGGRFWLTGLAATTVTLVAQVGWHGPWSWWVPMLAGLAVTLALARGPRVPPGQPAAESGATRMQNGWPERSA